MRCRRDRCHSRMSIFRLLIMHRLRKRISKPLCVFADAAKAVVRDDATRLP